MILTPLDWLVIAAYFALNLAIGFFYMKRASGDIGEFFLSGRNVSWWLAGTSMVATTFAADTPLVVTGLIYAQGIAGNWLWWSFLLSRDAHRLLLRPALAPRPRADRHGVRRAALLRPARHLPARLPRRLPRLPGQHHHHGLGQPGDGQDSRPHPRPDDHAPAAHRGLLLPRAHPGLQRRLRPVGGAVDRPGPVRPQDVHGHPAGVLRRPRRRRNGAHWPRTSAPSTPRTPSTATPRDTLAFIPSSASPFFLSFLVLLSLNWWASWYPGAEPGGGGYIAQRIFSAKNEKHSLGATLWFNIAHYALRPWPWILTALVALVLLPNPTAAQGGMEGRVRLGDGPLPAAQPARPDAGRLRGGVHVHHRHAPQPRRVVHDQRHLQALLRARTQPERHYVAASRIATILVAVLSRLRDRLHAHPRRVHRHGLEVPARRWARARAWSSSCAGTGGASTPGARSPP